MRKNIKEFVNISSSYLPIQEPIYEFGSLQVEGQIGFADLRPIFPNKKYVGADMRKGAGVDVILNLHKIDLPSESVGTVLLLDTLEHVEFPKKAIEEIHRVLKSRGTIIMSSVMNFPIHDHPYDYWRFTPEAFKSLLSPFETVIVDSAGEEDFPHTIVGVGTKQAIDEKTIDRLKKKILNWKDNQRYELVRFVTLLLPPAIMKFIIQIKRSMK